MLSKKSHLLQLTASTRYATRQSLSATQDLASAAPRQRCDLAEAAERLSGCSRHGARLQGGDDGEAAHKFRNQAVVDEIGLLHAQQRRRARAAQHPLRALRPARPPVRACQCCASTTAATSCLASKVLCHFVKAVQTTLAIVPQVSEHVPVRTPCVP